MRFLIPRVVRSSKHNMRERLVGSARGALIQLLCFMFRLVEAIRDIDGEHLLDTIGPLANPPQILRTFSHF
jgi:hypothetical protein